jgi:DNA-binding NtrC family response regulator
MGGTLLVIDDDPATCRLLRAVLGPEGFEVLVAHDAKTGLELSRGRNPLLVILDLHLPDANGIDVLDELRQVAADLPVVMLTAHADVKTAVRATRHGAFDYLTKPVDADELIVVVGRALETRALKSEVAELRQRLGTAGNLSAQMGPSQEIATVVEQVRVVAETEFSVVVLGETGTGKELVAQAIHRESARHSGPFVAVDCGAIPEALLESELFGHEKGAFTGADHRRDGRFRLAQGGTVFLDEVGNLPLGLQAKLLRVLESRQMQSVGSERSTRLDVRIVAATNEDLPGRVGAGKFRADLFFRLAQYTITLPPLRERNGDIPHLARRFLEEVRVELRRPIRELAPDALAALQRHAWPGNVRELRNVIRQAVLETREDVVRRIHVQKFLRQNGAPGSSEAAMNGLSLKERAEAAAREAERVAICETLRTTLGNKSRAARALSTDFKTLHLKMKALGIRARDFSP